MSRRVRRFAWLALALFAAVCATAQLEHHDIVCHLKTPMHCTGCASNPPGAHPHAPSPIDKATLAEAGRATVDLPELTGALLPVRCSGRAPPASA